MPIRVPCLKCKTVFQVPSKLAGTTVRCQACGFMLRLPSPEKIQAKKKAHAGAAKSAAGKTATGKTAVRKSKLGKPPAPPRKNAASKPAKQELIGADFFDGPLDLLDTPTGGAPANAGASIPEPTVLSCSHCAGLLYYDPNFANQTVACPHCGNHLVMPEL